MIYGREGMMALLLGVFFDLLIGDPHCFYHPIRLVGNLISVTEKGLRAVFPKTEQGEKTAGVFLSVIVWQLCFIWPEKSIRICIWL